jgi:hypothetical protein
MSYIHIGIESVEDAKHVLRPVLIDEINRPSAVELRVASVEPCSDFVGGVVLR